MDVPYRTLLRIRPQSHVGSSVELTNLPAMLPEVPVRGQRRAEVQVQFFFLYTAQQLGPMGQPATALICQTKVRIPDAASSRYSKVTGT